MVALNFKARFADDVEQRIKRQSIRALRKRPFKLGDDLQLYTGMRTKTCRKLGPDEKCWYVRDISILNSKTVCLFEDGNWRAMTQVEITQLAKDDGFDTPRAMVTFFEETHGLPFYGQLIRW
jgi:hypothetical protein